MTVHTFSSTRSAYDATQTDERIKDGDVLHIPSERVVGLADTWPVAVTWEAHGELHTLDPNATSADAWAVSAGVSAAQITAAVQFADAHGYAVNPAFRSSALRAEHVR